MVSAIPKLECHDAANRLLMPVFGLWLSVAYPAHLVNRAGRREALAAGGFLLVERAAFEEIGGYERLRSHIVEDVLTARLVKATGRCIELVLGRRLFTTCMYEGWRDLWEGITKNAFAGLDFRLGSAVLAVATVLGFAVAPAFVLVILAARVVAAGATPLDGVALLGFGFSTVALLVVHALIARELRFPIVYALAAPFAHASYAAAIVVSAVRGRFGSGVSWKGRSYYGSEGVVPADRLLR